MSMELIQADFQYSLAGIEPYASSYTLTKMPMRIENNGFCEMPFYCYDDAYTPYMDVSDYYELQAVVSGDEKLELEADMLKYVDKIIELCDEYGVELIFYRAPYVSTENELKKANWLEEYLESKGILYLDLEKEMTFDISTDFLDYYHLRETGAVKATDFLSSYILEAMN